MENTKVIEKLFLEDGRAAERHISTNADGEKLIEIYVEEKRPLKLEKRITEKRKEVLAEQRVETIRDGEVVDMQVSSLEPQVKMQLRDHIALAEKAELHASGYVSKKDLAPIVANAVVAGIQALLESKHAVNLRPLMAQSVVEQNVALKKKNIWDTMALVGMSVFVVLQTVYLGYVMLVN